MTGALTRGTCGLYIAISYGVAICWTDQARESTAVYFEMSERSVCGQSIPTVVYLPLPYLQNDGDLAAVSG